MSDALIILPAPRCRRSRMVLKYLAQHRIPHTVIPLDSADGQSLRRRHDLRASPGILVHGVSVNPFEVLDKGKCRVDDAAFERHILQKMELPDAAGI